MYKVGDEVVIINDDCSPYGRLGEIVIITDIVNNSILTCQTSYRNSIWSFCIDDIVSLEIYDSPLYKAMMEEKIDEN